MFKANLRNATPTNTVTSSSRITFSRPHRWRPSHGQSALTFTSPVNGLRIRTRPSRQSFARHEPFTASQRVTPANTATSRLESSFRRPDLQRQSLVQYVSRPTHAHVQDFNNSNRSPTSTSPLILDSLLCLTLPQRCDPLNTRTS